MELSVNLSEASSRIVIVRNAITRLADYIDLNRKVMIITDEGVPAEYQQLVLSQCPNGHLFITEQAAEPVPHSAVQPVRSAVQVLQHLPVQEHSAAVRQLRNPASYWHW